MTLVTLELDDNLLTKTHILSCSLTCQMSHPTNSPRGKDSQLAARWINSMWTHLYLLLWICSILVWSLLFKISVSDSLSVYDLELQQFVYFVFNAMLNFALQRVHVCQTVGGDEYGSWINSVTPLFLICQVNSMVFWPNPDPKPLILNICQYWVRYDTRRYAM